MRSASKSTGGYDSAYYATFADSGRASADIIAPLLAQRHQPASVLDVGCGLGYFLDAFAALGVRDTHGIDAPFNDGRAVREGGHGFSAVDLQAELLSPGRSFDLVLCLEVAEHLRSRHAERLVSGLTQVAPVIAFSAAIPRQPGEGHVNLRYPSYWAGLFASRGFHPSTELRTEIWDNRAVSWWYRQNLIVYTREPQPWVMLDVVHPEQNDVPVSGLSGREGLSALIAAGRRRLRREAGP